MKDWEISETYVLPRILCLRSGNCPLLGKPSKPNLRFLPLNENSNEWATWKRSDYFYPEMIPEPDYSDSEDDTDMEDEEENRSYSQDPRSALERLRDLTEVYVSNVDTKKDPSKSKGSVKKQVGPTPKTDSKQTKETPKDESSKPVKPASKAPQAKKSPPTSPKAPAKADSKSSSKVSKAAPKGSPPATTKVDKSPKPTPKNPPKAKSPPLVSKSSKPAPSKPSAVKKTTFDSSEPKPEVSPSASKAKPESKSKAPPTPAKTKTVKPTAKGKTSPKTSPKSKAASKGPAVAKMATPAGDAKETSAVSSKSPPSSPASDRSALSSAASEGHSSDEEQLIKPKKPVNPYLQSSERQKLHKELKFSQKYGKLGASSKTELQLALERYTENKVKRELNAEEKTSLEKILEFQAKKIEMQEIMDKCPAWIDRLQKPPTATADPLVDEFYRVHAKVVSSNILTHCFLSDDDRSECSSPKKLQLSDSGSDS